MALYSELDTRHRVAFAFVVIGFILCVTGVASPDWIETGVDHSKITKSLKLNAKLGLWTSCIDVDIPRNRYRMNECNTGVDVGGRINAARFLVLCQLFLSLMGVLLTFIRFASCCTSARTRAVGHGILTFFNAACGFGAVGLMVLEVKHTMDFLQGLIPYDFTYNWGFYVYIGGCCTTVIVSAILCFFMPKEAAELPQVFTQQGYAMDGQIQQSKTLPPPTHSSHM